MKRVRVTAQYLRTVNIMFSKKTLQSCHRTAVYSVIVSSTVDLVPPPP